MSHFIVGRQFRFICIACAVLVYGAALLTGRASAQEWQAVATKLIAAEKPGYGGLTGLAVNPQSGDVFVYLSDRGLYRSTDQAQTFEKVDKADVKGRTEWPGSLMLSPRDPAKHIISATVYGGPIRASADGGRGWKVFDKASMHVDWCVVDWSDPQTKLVLALKHEAAGALLASRDGGASFETLGKGFMSACVFDAQTAVAVQAAEPKAKPALVRTTDGGRTFAPCGDYATTALPVWRGPNVYWLMSGGIITTADKGATWKQICELKEGKFGPVFGKDDKQMFVLTRSGIVETQDAGANWSKPLPLPKGVNAGGNLTWFAFDPQHNLLYTMQMTSDLYRLKLER